MDKSDKRSISSNESEKQEESKSAKKPDLSVAQVLGSAVAAVIAAFAAGQLGVYGTFLGAGVVSLVATSGGPIFQHFFSKTGEQLKEVTVPPKARQAPVRDPAAGWKDDDGRHTGQAVHNAEALHGNRAAATQLLPTTSWGRETENGTQGSSEGADATQVLRTSGATQALRSEDATRMLRRDDATRVLGTVKRPAGAPGAEERAGARAEEPPGNGEFTEATTHGTKWRGWRRTLLPAVVVFVIAIGGVTLYEAISGHSVSGGKGTSISGVFRPGHGSSTGGSPDAPPATPDPDTSENGGSPTPTPEGSQQSTDPSDRNSGESGRTDSGDNGGKTTPTPAPSRSQSSGTGDTGSGDTDTGDTSGSDSQQGGQDGTGSGETGGAGSGSQLPQGQQPGLSSQG
ncbi:hypothetical protein ACQEU8_09250 [Streptomyces sp. CA-250714]|uniref:hypothetical protein n=1 Tax=Streptomyces sp. CA-250714 TaxID=3240060 RepID=UPI003D94E921